MELTEEQKAAELEAKNKAAEEEAENDSEDTIDGDDSGDDAGAGVHKKDYLKMSDEEILADLKEKHKDATPEQLLSEMAKQAKIIGHKNRAITSLKKTAPEKKVVEEKKEIDDLDKPLTKRELLGIEAKKSVEFLAKNSTKDEAEQKAILDAYEHDIVKTGDAEKDFKKALAIANSSVVENYKKNQSIAADNENYLSRFSGSQTYGNNSGGSMPNDAVKRATAENLRKAGYSQKDIDSAVSKL